MKQYLLSIFIFFVVSIPFGSLAQHRISGTISDAKTGESLFGATVYDENSGRGGVSNAFVNFVFSLDSDSVQLRVSYVGYQSQRFVLPSASAKNLQIELVQSINLQEFEVVGRVPFKQEGIKMDRKFVKALPQFMGESDVLKAAQFLPGVQRASELSAGMVVRGGSPDQNLILLDGIPVYNAYHLFGLFSVFNPEMVQNSYLLKGSFPARYGGRLSSIMDIQTREGSKDKFGGSVGIGPITSHLFLEGPIDSLSTFAFSGRRTFLDVLVQPFVYAETDGEGAAIMKFHDFNFKLNRRLNSRDRIYFSAYFGKDKFGGKAKDEDVESEFTLGWGNQMAMLRWTRNYEQGVFFNLKAYYSDYSFRTGFEQISDDQELSYEYKSGIRDFSLNGDWETSIASNLFRFGGKLTHHMFSPGITTFEATGDSEGEGFKEGSTLKNLESTLFVEWERSLGEKWKSNLGINANAITAQEVNYVYADPRIKLDYLQSDQSTYSIGFSQMTQSIHLLTNPAISMPTDLWMPSTSSVKPARSREVNITYNYKADSYNWGVAVYHKHLWNVIELQEGKSVFSGGENWEENVVAGTGEAYGIELSANKYWEKFQLGGSVVYSRSLRRIEGVNNDTWFPFKYDRPLYVNAFGMYEIRPNKKFSFAFNLSSGNRITMAEGQFKMPGASEFGGGSDRLVYSDRNGYQFPLYHRLDVSYEVSKAKNKGERTWKFSVLNVYNQFNPMVVDPFQDPHDNGESVTVNAYSVIPFFPSFKWIRTF